LATADVPSGIHREALAIVEQAIPESADQRQIDSRRTGRYQSGDHPLQPVCCLNLALHSAIMNRIITTYNISVVDRATSGYSTKAELNRCSQVCEVLAGTGISRRVK
jgi:hypothetical protein